MLPFRVFSRPQTDWSHGLPTVASSPRFHTDDRPDCLQISYAQNPNGRPYPFSFQSLVVPSSPSSPHEKPPIPFISSSLRTLFLATDGDTPPFTHSVLREDSHRALSAKGPHLSSSPILRLLFPEITRIPAISTGWRGSCRSRVTSHQLAPGRIAGSKVTAHQSMTYLISPVSSLVLVHSYFCFTKPFCTRSSIVPRPPSRLHFTLNQEVSL
jgi:hypothetical protein